MEFFRSFDKWLDDILKDGIPDETVAINFNIYETDDGSYNLQIVGCDRFDPEDEDWACYDLWSSGEDYYSLKSGGDISDWEDALDRFTDLINAYLKDGEYGDELKKLAAVSVGFVDGELELLFERD